MRVDILYYTVMLEILTEFCCSYKKEDPNSSLEDVNRTLSEVTSLENYEELGSKEEKVTTHKQSSDKIPLRKTRRFRIVNGFETPRTNSDGIYYKSEPEAVMRIVGGMSTSIKVFPYNVAVTRWNKQWCGGSIIDEQWVLTAGHCMEDVIQSPHEINKFKVRAGSSYYSRGGYQALANRVFFHPNYVPKGADYDFSLIRLDRPLPMGKSIAVINLPDSSYKIFTTNMLVVTGWGSTHKTGFDNIPDRLRFVVVPPLETAKCEEEYRFPITPRMVCAGYPNGGQDACNHDSGGPAAYNNVLLGVVSFGGKICGDPRSPGVYSRVSSATDWINETITKNEAYNVPELKKKIDEVRLSEKHLKRLSEQLHSNNKVIMMWLKNIHLIDTDDFKKMAQSTLSILQSLQQ